jgi:hypothetical protein
MSSSRHLRSKGEANEAQMNTDKPTSIGGWIEALEMRHLRDLRFSEVTRALRALSSSYVERRGGLAHGAPLDGRGKRAAFAIFYGPLHFLTVQQIVTALAPPPIDTVFDLGCGTGAAGAAWALSFEPAPAIQGVDRHQWAVDEARWTYSSLGLRGRAIRGDATRVRLPDSAPKSDVSKTSAGVLVAYTINEMSDAARSVLLKRLLESARRGAQVLIIEPISNAVTPWWPAWREAILRAGGRADDWRFSVDLPDLVRRLDRAAGLDHRRLTAKSLWLAGRS